MARAMHHNRPPHDGRYKVWPREKRQKLLKMCGYFSKEEMAESLGMQVAQIISMVNRMHASYRVTKNKEDYVE